MSSLEECVAAQEQSKADIAYRLASFIKLSKPKRTKAALESRLADVQRYWDECRQRHLAITSLADSNIRSTHAYFKEDMYHAIADCMDSTREALLEYLAEMQPQGVPSSSLSGGSTKTPSCENKIHPVTLPVITLPKFGGDFVEWSSFRDLFQTLVASRTDLTDSQRLHYLKGSLHGEAANLLLNTSVTDANYKSAWDLLTQEYERKRAIVYSHLQRFVDAPRVSSGSVRELKSLLDLSREVRSALINLSRPIDKWEDLYIYLVVCKLDKATRLDWELSLGDVNLLPDFKSMEVFLNKRVGALKSAESGTSTVPSRTAKFKPETTRVHQVVASRQPRPPNVKSAPRTASAIACVCCGESHLTYQCGAFLSKSVPQRIALVQKNERCLNCFAPGHVAKNCASKYSCRHCQQHHHSLLHMMPKSSSGFAVKENAAAPTTGSEIAHAEDSGASSSNLSHTQFCHTVLPTASVLLTSPSGRSIRVRALLDQGSQSSFVTSSLVQVLRPRLDSASVHVSGIGAALLGDARQIATMHIRPLSGNTPPERISALVLPKLSSYLPPPVPVSADLSHLANLPLADLQPFSHASIDLIIGADYYGQFLRDGLVRGSKNSPSAQRTVFGWVLSGRLADSPSVGYEASSGHIATVPTFETLADSLQKFWEVEEIPNSSTFTPDEEACESHFRETHSRLPDGRYMVRLPLKTPVPLPIGDTSRTALRIFLSHESRMVRRPELGHTYDEFLREYERLGHMELVPVAQRRIASAVYLPHHPVVKETSSTTRVRVVFNASCISSNGYSLNDLLLTGSKLQADLFSIILRWRSFKYVYTADLEKMFRQIMIHPANSDLQRIFWRSAPMEEVQEYRLLTVTYGTAPAPFLANRVINQLVVDEGEKFPLAAPILSTDIYVDDVMFGGNDLPRLIETRNQLRELLRAGGFRPYKWASNNPSLLSDLPVEDVSPLDNKTLGEEPALKVLGIFWDPTRDTFAFKVEPQDGPLTKRSFLSLISRIFDPHGWVAPFLISGKILLQKLWLRKIDWDEPLPEDLSHSFLLFQSQLTLLNRVNIPRWTLQDGQDRRLELHGFADASNSAYAAVVYLRVQVGSCEAKVSLLYAKTKVAPIKLLSVPRLELCAAVLLVRAMEFVRRSMALADIPLFCWTDSAVVLAWLQSPASRWKVFVAHRVSKIQHSLPSAVWSHVPTSENPADCASRGITADILLDHPLWWSGPSWLGKESSAWPQGGVQMAEGVDLEQRGASCVHTVAVSGSEDEFDLPQMYSSWPKLLRVTAFILRFVRNLRNKDRDSSPCLPASEIESARVFWCKRIQARHFGAGKSLDAPKLSTVAMRKISALSPFLDAKGLLRVGGRLSNAKIPYEVRHPILFPSCRIAELLARHVHLVTMHGGLRVTLHFLRQTYWVISARSLLKRSIFQCVVCTRHRAASPTQLLGSLPEPRVTPSRPFTHTGVDYAGPFHIRSSKGRGIKTHKAYLVVFVCLSVRAVHLEVADDCTTEGFLAAFERFTSRRGLPTAMYSDNGSNFVGADRELSRCITAVLQNRDLQTRFADDGVVWHFIPPAAPHFGGLWEAGVKSVKHHLKRVIGTFTPTYEEFATLLCKIECVLNSRPIGPLHDDVESLESITPGHFLIGSHLRAVPQPSVLELNENRLSRWQFVARTTEAFWKIWAADYLNAMQQRGKWRTRQSNVAIGDMVLLKSHNLPPAKWELGRITQCFPGSDGLVRVVSVKTQTSELKRLVTQVCLLPVTSNSSS